MGLGAGKKVSRKKDEELLFDQFTYNRKMDDALGVNKNKKKKHGDIRNLFAQPENEEGENDNEDNDNDVVWKIY